MCFLRVLPVQKDAFQIHLLLSMTMVIDHALQCDEGADNDAFTMLMLLNNAKEVSRVEWQYEQINSEQHLQSLRHRNGFQKRYH